jgi:hypothetical protein
MLRKIVLRNTSLPIHDQVNQHHTRSIMLHNTQCCATWLIVYGPHYAFLTSALGSNGRFASGNSPHNHWKGSWVTKRNVPAPTANGTPASSPKPSQYTEWAMPAQLFLWERFNIIFPSNILVCIPSDLFLSGVPTKILYAFRFPLCVLHVPPIAIPFIQSS